MTRKILAIVYIFLLNISIFLLLFLTDDMSIDALIVYISFILIYILYKLCRTLFIKSKPNTKLLFPFCLLFLFLSYTLGYSFHIDKYDFRVRHYYRLPNYNLILLYLILNVALITILYIIGFKANTNKFKEGYSIILNIMNFIFSLLLIIGVFTYFIISSFGGV